MPLFLSAEGKGVHSKCEKVCADKGTDCTTITATRESSPQLLCNSKFCLCNFTLGGWQPNCYLVSYQCTVKWQQKVQSEYPFALDHRAETSPNWNWPSAARLMLSTWQQVISRLSTFRTSLLYFQEQKVRTSVLVNTAIPRLQQGVS
jgi:hypothetical protein